MAVADTVAVGIAVADIVAVDTVVADTAEDFADFVGLVDNYS